MIDLHIGWLLTAGTALLAMTVLPSLLDGRPFSLPIIYIAAGFLVFEAFGRLPALAPLADPRDAQIAEYATEAVVVVSLATVGLSLERRPGLVSWSTVWRLLGITMPLTIGGLALAGFYGAGLGLAAAVLLGGVLAPTDPVLADDVQVSAPGEDHDRDEVRFTLTAEAGLNDALAFPFTYLAIALSAASLPAVALDWVATDVAYRILVGAAAGYLLGRALRYLIEHWQELPDATPSAGLFAIAAALLVYGLTEAVGGYGFLAVFVGALTRSPATDDIRQEMHGFVEQIESILLAITLLGVGALVSAGVLDALTWEGLVIAVALVFVIRPAAGLVGLIGSPIPVRERAAIAFLGIRGIATIYYLAYATTHADFAEAELATVWAIGTVAIMVSVVVHGISAAPVVRWLRGSETM